MAAPPPPARRASPGLAVFVAGALIVAAITVGLLIVQPLGARDTLPLPAGSSITLASTPYGYTAAYNFSWGWGAILRGRWSATANTSATVLPALNCFHCPLIRIYEMHGLEGTFNYTFGGIGQEYPNMTLRFVSAVPTVVQILDTVEVAYPPLTAIYPAGTILSGTGLTLSNFTIHAPGAYLVGSWTAVNTTMWSYDSIPPNSTNCAGWPVDSPPMVYHESFNVYLMPGAHSVGPALCSTRPWTIQVTAAIGYFYP